MAPWWTAHSDGLLLRLAFLLTFAAYARTIVFDFVFDDHLQIALNPWVQAWQFVPHYFTGHVWNFQQPAWAGNYYRPLFLLWMRVMHAVFGLTPGWWHLMSIALHLVATWLVYRLGLRLLGSRRAAAVAAMLFGVNPVHIEAVAWISGNTETLVAIACMATFLAYLNWRDGGTKRAWWLTASVMLYVVSVLLKETGVVMPGVILAYEILAPDENAGRRTRFNLRRTALLLAPYAVITLAYLGARGAVLRGVVSPMHHRPLASVVLTWPKILWCYLQLLAWPFRLNAYYDDFDLVKSFWSRDFVLPTLGIVALTGAFIVLFRRSRRMLFGGVAILLPLLPVVVGSVVFQMHDFIHDRFLYVPSIALAFMLASAFLPGKAPDRVVGRKSSAGARTETSGWLGTTAAVALGLTLTVATVVQSLPWDNDIALFTHARQLAPHNVRATEGLAEAYGMVGDLDAALRVQREATIEKPDYWAGLCNLGIYYYRAENYAEAERTLMRAIAAWPPEIQPMSGSQFYYLGMARLNMGHFAEAEAPLRRAVELRPDSPGYHFGLGTVLKRLGKVQEAEVEFRAEAVNRKRIDQQMKILGLNAVP
ncbi:MAG: tetratricopeptide repeat protein [Acidobacteriia bacterium]|nr:tetratricopeptide repeat protein [Terriglobia bacterium]